jgi:hypothetical protein
MKVVFSLILAIALVCVAAPPIYAQAHQVAPGTEVHLTLTTPINSKTAMPGDKIVAVTTTPITLADQTVIPAGTRIHGEIGNVQKAKWFSSFKGQAYLAIVFKSLEIDSRLIPVQMSLLAIGQPRVNSSTSPVRKDVKITEGEKIQEKHDYKGDVVGVLIPGGAGGTIGLIAGHVGPGLGIGLGVGAAYVVVRKGKEVSLPVNTAMLARVDNPVTVPVIAAYTGVGTSQSTETAQVQ